MGPMAVGVLKARSAALVEIVAIRERARILHARNGIVANYSCCHGIKAHEHARTLGAAP